MKRVLMVGLTIATLSLLAGFAPTVFAHGPTEREATAADEEEWEAMCQACDEGDWEAMAEAAEEIHGKDSTSLPCHDQEDYAPATRWGGMGSHMGGGMMGRGIMGWR